jgi:hypothetical protein
MTHTATATATATKEFRPRSQWLPVEVATFDLVRTCTYREAGGATRVGAEAMSRHTKRSAQLIANESNPNYHPAKQGLVDAVEMELVTQRYPILYAHARMLNHVVWPLPSPDLLISDVELLTAFSAWNVAIGMTCQEIHSALDPNGPGGGRITPDEATAIADKGNAEMRRFMELLERVRVLAGVPTQMMMEV